MENGLGGKVMTTYICRNCQKFSCQLFKDALTWCGHCKALSCVCPTVAFGLSIEDLGQVYNVFDLYAQYAICEGFGMPQVEAAACGVPIAATNYSAMEDVVANTQGYPVPVRTFFRELETNAERAYPDNQAMSEIMMEFFTNTPAYRMKKSIAARQGAVTRYDWDDTAKQWENYIDNYTPVGKQGKWDSPPSFPYIPEARPENFSNNAEFVHWLFKEMLREPERIHKEEGSRLMRDLNFGARITYGDVSPLDQQKVFDLYKNRALNKLNAEQVRVGMLPLPNVPYVVDAHNRRRPSNGAS